MALKGARPGAILSQIRAQGKARPDRQAGSHAEPLARAHGMSARAIRSKLQAMTEPQT